MRTVSKRIVLFCLFCVVSVQLFMPATIQANSHPATTQSALEDISIEQAGQDFLQSPLFTIIQNFARLLGFFIVAFAIFRVVQRVTSQGGEGGLMQSMRMLLPAVVVAAILMQLRIITTIVGFAVGVVAGIIDLFGDAVGA